MNPMTGSNSSQPDARFNGGIRPVWSEKRHVETFRGSGHDFQNIRQRGLIENLGHRPLQLAEDAAHVAPALPAPRLQVIEAAMEFDGALERLDDLAQGDSAGQSRQSKSAAKPPAGSHQPLAGE